MYCRILLYKKIIWGAKNMKTIILAAGEGQRMKSNKPKVLHKLLGKSMLSYVIEAAKKIGSKKIITVIGHKGEEIQKTIKDGVIFVSQNERKGTGHAVMMAEDYIGDSGQVLILYGDTPLITSQTLQNLIDFHKQNSNGATIVTSKVEDPSGYGRIIRENNAFSKIVEHKDATKEQLEINEVNTGIYVFEASLLKKALLQLKNDNSQGEYYLTDTMEILLNDGEKVGCFFADDSNEFFGVNNRVQLALAGNILKDRINTIHMMNGVTIIDPSHTYISSDALIGCDTTIYPGVIIEGKTKIGENCIIGSCSKLTDMIIEDNVDIQNSVLVDSVIGSFTTVGPFAYVRPKCVVGRHCKIGDFVEIKNSIIGDNTKASHLTYLGDSDIGSNINIGCGTVTVNYDGKNKYRTKVKDNSFIGCNVNLIAPVTVEEGAFIAAGSTITDDVPKNSLSIARSKQINKNDWQLS